MFANARGKKNPVDSTKALPIITFDANDIYVGDIVKGESKEITFEFTNTGNADLLIEIATTCKCTSIDYPIRPIAPGGRGKIVAIYDTTTQSLGESRKTIDIVANTDPIVVEAIFHANVIKKPE